MADKAQSWMFVEDYISESEVMRGARAAAVELGAAPVSPGTGAALRMLAAATAATSVLEIGTGAGVSGLWLLEGMPRDGVLTSIDCEVEFHKQARRIWAGAGVSEKRSRLITGRALDILPRMAAGAYDMVVLDAKVQEAPSYVDYAAKLVRKGGLIILVHALWGDQVADPARRDADTVVCRELVRFFAESEDFLPALLPVGDGLEVVVKR